MIPNDITPSTELAKQTTEAIAPAEVKKRRYTTSDKVLAANRRNAGRSTGPRRAVESRFNAVKHGILSGQVVVRGLRIQEQEGEFKRLRERYWESYAPVGPAEEMLVEKIVTCQWRLRRALQAETGEIALSVDGQRWTWESKNAIERLFLFGSFRDVSKEVEKSTQGLTYLREVLERVRDEVNSSGELTEATCAWVRDRFGDRSNGLTKALEGYRERYLANVNGLSASAEASEAMADKEELKGNHHRAVLRFIEMKLEYYARLNRERWEREDKKETARQAADMLPSAEVLEKILRYEGSLERQLYRAMNQLERLQRRRNGENVPPPMTMQLGRG